MSRQTGRQGCSVSDRGPGRSPQWDPPVRLASRFAKYYKMENGSEYRTLLKAFGIRFDVLVYGNVSPGAGQVGGQGRSPRPILRPEEAPPGAESCHGPAPRASAGHTPRPPTRA